MDAGVPLSLRCHTWESCTAGIPARNCSLHTGIAVTAVALRPRIVWPVSSLGTWFSARSGRGFLRCRRAVRNRVSTIGLWWCYPLLGFWFLG